MLRTVASGGLSVAYLESGDPAGTPIVLLHGFPYDVHAYDDVAAMLAPRCRVVVPYLRGFGATRLAEGATRTGQQAALAADLLALLDTLGIDSAILAGYDWGGRAACIVSALWPARARGLVSVNGYNIQCIRRALEPAPPEVEYRYWYQYYFHSERGRRGLAQNRRELCKLLWRLWSPSWRFSDATYEQTAASFDNPDFVEVTIHSYRHRYGLVLGDPAFDPLEARLAEQPPISVPSVVLDPADDGVIAGASDVSRFTRLRAHQRIAGAGHNLPQENPRAFADAVLSLL
jgi:pimeloyl-ACP methyl ester carboxylesterase